MTAMSVLSAIAGRGGRSFRNLFTNSPAICEASLELPPLPINKSLFPFLKDETISSETSLIKDAYCEINSSFVLMLSVKRSLIFFSFTFSLIAHNSLLTLLLLHRLFFSPPFLVSMLLLHHILKLYYFPKQLFKCKIHCIKGVKPIIFCPQLFFGKGKGQRHIIFLPPCMFFKCNFKAYCIIIKCRKEFFQLADLFFKLCLHLWHRLHFFVEYVIDHNLILLFFGCLFKSGKEYIHYPVPYG